MEKEQLIDKYLPADYDDCFSESIPATKGMTVDVLFDRMFCNYPLPVRWMLKLRDSLMKPFGLKTGATFRDRIIERTDEEIIVGANDKHLNFFVSVFCSSANENMQTVSVRTVVKFNNLLGKVYFAFIFIFHKLIVGTLFRRAINNSNDVSTNNK